MTEVLLFVLFIGSFLLAFCLGPHVVIVAQKMLIFLGALCNMGKQFVSQKFKCYIASKEPHIKILI